MVFKKDNLNKGFTLIELVVVMAIFLFIVGAALDIFISIIQSQKKVLAEQQFLNQISYVEEYMSKALRMATVDTYGNCLRYVDATQEKLGDPNRGYFYLLTREKDGVYQGIEFLNNSNKDPLGNPSCQEFFLDGNILKEENWSIDPDGLSPVALTPTSLQIKSIRFSINGGGGSVIGQNCGDSINACGASDKNSNQPRVTMLLKVAIPGENKGTGTCSVDDNCPSDKACDLLTHTCITTRTIQTTISQRNLNVQQ